MSKFTVTNFHDNPNQEAWIDAATGVRRITRIASRGDGPWVVCGSGLDQVSFCVFWDTALYTTHEEAEVSRQAKDIENHLTSLCYHSGKDFLGIRNRVLNLIAKMPEGQVRRGLSIRLREISEAAGYDH